MVKSPAGVDAIGEMASVRAGCGGVAIECAGKSLEIDLAGEAPIADALKAMVPIGGGKPHFDLDVGIGGGRGCDFDTAEGGELFVERNLFSFAGGARRRDEAAGGHDFGGDDVGLTS